MNFITVCPHDNDAGVTCHNNCNATTAMCHPIPNIFFLKSCLYFVIAVTVEMKNCEDGDINLENGTIASRGQVVLCQEGRWMRVCNDRWGVNEARAVCSQLKYDPNGIFTQH